MTPSPSASPASPRRRRTPGAGSGACASPRALAHQPGERLEHHQGDDDHGEAEREQQGAEADVAALLRALDAARPRARRGTLTQLLAATALERRLLLEGNLELGEALSHSHGQKLLSPGRARLGWTARAAANISSR